MEANTHAFVCPRFDRCVIIVTGQFKLSFNFSVRSVLSKHTDMKFHPLSRKGAIRQTCT